ncbi:MAG: class I SAM-dependent methyltransferase [Acidimicrobiia bacterium]
MSSDDAISSFYEAHPYPPPIGDLDGYRVRWSDDNRRRAEFHRYFPYRAYTDQLDILVAGCGTSQAARHAVRWPRATVTGIDVSETSLNETAKLKERYDLNHLTLQQLPIERILDLDQQYDLIVCTGVLHHLADPAEGLRQIRKALKPDGALLLMVYGRYGRIGVSMIQDYSRLLGIEPTAEEINALGSTLREIPMNHPLSPMLRNTPDFRSPDALADAFLNPRERAYSVPELFDLLGSEDLGFGRWILQAPYRPQCGAPATTPHATQLVELSDHDQYAAMELLRGSMVRHTVIAHQPASAGTTQSGGWTDNSVPIKLPDTIAVDERLPPGAAAVLINTAHTNTDLVLPVTPAELKLVDHIDGQKTLGEIAASAGDTFGSRDGPSRRFFEKLWHWDQIVFDHSGSQLDV